MLFAEEGCNVTVNYLNHGRQALDLCEKLGAAGCDALPVKADVSSPEGASTLIDQTLSRFGNIDVLVNNAGIAQQKLFTDITDSDWQRMLAVNVTGVFQLLPRSTADDDTQ
jgi:3-oxoacyl-[acyl-carrier protein] reductase